MILKLYKNILLTGIMVFLPLLGIAQQAGDLDRSFNYGRGADYQFNYGTGANNTVNTTAFQADGKIIIGGSFTSYNGASRNNIARLNTDGTLDATFNPGTGANNIVHTIAVQTDGKIIIGGSFTSFNGTTRNRIARLNADGSRDVTFNPGTGANGTVQTTALQADGKIIIGGAFTSYNGTTRNRIARLNADGSLDATFNPSTGANGTVQTAALQSDGKIIIGGEFFSYNGTSRYRIARINVDGSLDANFNVGTGANSSVFTIALQDDDKIIIGGLFNSYNGSTSTRIARLNADGSLDPAFNPGTGANDRVITTSVQADGKIIIGGFFTSYNGTSRNRIARLNADGSLDSTFNLGTGANGWVYTTSLQADGKIIIGGIFTSYNGTPSDYIARLNSDCSIDASFNPKTGAVGGVLSIAFQADGKILIGGGISSYNGTLRNCITRLNSDGSLDSTFNTGTGVTSWVYSIALQPDGKILIGGGFSSYNGTARNNIARLNSDGSLDATFNPGTGANQPVQTVVVQADGKILIGGSFTTFNGTIRNNIARLNSDGSLDATFNPVIGGVNSVIMEIALQPDGKILIAGDFTSCNGTARNDIAQLNTDGSLDATFNPGTGINGFLRSIAIQSDGKTLIGGSFNSYNGSSRNNIARLNTDGSLDANFNTGTAVNTVLNAIVLQSDGKILIGGDFTSYNGTVRNRIARLNSDGSSDASFNFGTGANNGVYSMALQADGKILTGGYFTGYNGFSTPRITRIHGCVMPETPSISGNATFCFGTSTVLTSSAATGNLWSNGENTQSITVTTPGTYTVQQISGVCTTSSSESVVTSIIATGTWLGTSTDWNNETNWCGGVPMATSDVTLPITGLLPTITGTTATCRNLTIPVGVTLNIGNGANFNLKGNLSGLGSMAGVSGSTLTLNGSTAQTIQRVNVGTLVVNNGAGVTLDGNVTLSDGITLTNGILYTENNNLILLPNATSPTETINSYILGNIRNTARPVGTGSVSMFGITIAAGTDNLDTVMIERGENAATYNGNEGIGHIWKIRAGNQPTSGREITLSWNPIADNGKDLTRLQVYRRPDTGGEWIRVGSIVDGSARSITITTDSFSDWTISDGASPLPVTLTSFTGKATQLGNQLNWTTSSEVNNQGFNVERSVDGKTFTKIGFVKGFGTTNTKQTYQFTDTQLSEAYYRLQQVDLDGKSEYSSTIKVGENVVTNLLEIYPNPASDKVTIRTNGTGTIEIVNNLGQVLITQPATTTNEINISKLAMGVYTVKFNGVSQKLVIR